MRLFNRRSAMKGAPAAVVGGAMVISDLSAAPTPMVPPPSTIGNIGLLGRASDKLREMTPLEMLEAKNRRKFHDAKELAEQAFRKRIDITMGGCVPNMNINALKSVSHQHKFHMQQKWFDAFKEEQKSWIDKLAAKFGIEWNKPGRWHGDEAGSTYTDSGPNNRY